MECVSTVFDTNIKHLRDQLANRWSRADKCTYPQCENRHMRVFVINVFDDLNSGNTRTAALDMSDFIAQWTYVVPFF